MRARLAGVMDGASAKAPAQAAETSRADDTQRQNPALIGLCTRNSLIRSRHCQAPVCIIGAVARGLPNRSEFDLRRASNIEYVFEELTWRTASISPASAGRSRNKGVVAG